MQLLHRIAYRIRSKKGYDRCHVEGTDGHRRYGECYQQISCRLSGRDRRAIQDPGIGSLVSTLSRCHLQGRDSGTHGTTVGGMRYLPSGSLPSVSPPRFGLCAWRIAMYVTASQELWMPVNNS